MLFMFNLRPGGDGFTYDVGMNGLVAPSESLRPHRCSPAIDILFTKMRSRLNGAGEPCLCRPIR